MKYINFTAREEESVVFFKKLGVDSDQPNSLVSQEDFMEFFDFIKNCRALSTTCPGMAWVLCGYLNIDFNQPREIIEAELKTLFSHEWARFISAGNLNTLNDVIDAGTGFRESETLQAVADLFADHDVHGDIASGPRM